MVDLPLTGFCHMSETVILSNLSTCKNKKLSFCFKHDLLNVKDPLTSTCPSPQQPSDQGWRRGLWFQGWAIVSIPLFARNTI